LENELIMKKKSFNSSHLYQLLQFLLLTKKEERNLFIISNTFEKSIIPNLGNKFIFIDNLDYKIKSNNSLDYIFKFIKQLIRLNKEAKKKLKYLKGNEIYGATLISKYLSKKNKIIALEDGTGNYRIPDLNFKQKIINIIIYLFIGVKKPFFMMENDFIYNKILTNKDKYPGDKENIQEIKLYKLWQQKNKKEQLEILQIFNLTSDIIKIIKKRKIILITQPIYEDGLIDSENEKIEIYRKCLSNYDLSDVIIKTHPREVTDYKEYFKEALIISAPIPFQLFSFLDIKYEKIITLYSTAALSISNKNKIVWCGTKFNKKLFRKLGDISLDKFK